MVNMICKFHSRYRSAQIALEIKSISSSPDPLSLEVYICHIIIQDIVKRFDAIIVI